ncbi:MAG TPA: D-glycerate dehydrogenase [Syntrophorhabdaceae bacterium]|nr:D-glycerate dehydrogenase [Syntrophorhabdaceae bacterium]
MTPRIYITRKLPFPAIDSIADSCDVVFHEGEESPGREEFLKNLADKDGILCLVADHVDKEAIDSAPNLKVISTMSAGFEHIDVAYATAKGIYVGYAPDALTDATADLAFSLLLAAARRVPEGDQFMRQRKWKISWSPLFHLGKAVWESTLGIIGMGKIGKAMMTRAKGFNMRILYTDPVRMSIEEENRLGVSFKSLNDLLKESDFVSVHVPVTEMTRHLINEERLKLMKPSAILINASRGATVDEAALVRALQEKWIAGAALDVYEREPVADDNPLLDLENVVLVPHIGSATVEARTKMAETAALNLISVLKGETPPRLLNPEVMAVRPLSQVKML